MGWNYHLRREKGRFPDRVVKARVGHKTREA